mgnify:CR=1 FL=1
MIRNNYIFVSFLGIWWVLVVMVMLIVDDVALLLTHPQISTINTTTRALLQLLQLQPLQRL